MNTTPQEILEHLGQAPKSYRRAGDHAGVLAYGTSLFADLSIEDLTITAETSLGTHHTRWTIVGRLNTAASKGLRPLADLLHLRGNLLIAGTVERDGSQPPHIDLLVYVNGHRLSFGHLNVVPKSLRLYTIFEDPMLPESRADLLCHVAIDGDHPVAFDLVATMTEVDAAWTFTYHGDPVALADGLGALPGLVGFHLDPGFPAEVNALLQGIHLHGYGISLNPHTAKLHYLGVELGLSADWQVIPKLLAITDPAVGLGIVQPLSSSRLFVPYIKGTLVLGKDRPVHMAVEADFIDDFTVKGRLYEESKIRIGDALATFLRISDLPAIDLDQLAFSASRSGDLAVSAHLSSDWTMPAHTPPGKGFALKGAWVHLLREAGDFSASVGADFAIAGVYFSLSARQPAPGAGWTFEGQTAKGMSIPLSKLVGDLIANFGGNRQPAALPASLDLKNINLSFNTKTKRASFHCDSLLTLGEASNGLHLRLEAGIGHDAVGKAATHFGGELTVGPLQFNLAFDKAGGGSTLVAGYRDPKDNPINILELLGALMNDPGVHSKLTISIKDALLARHQKQGVSKVLVLLHMDSGINLSNLPLVGKMFPAGQTVALEFQVLAATAAFTKAEVAGLNGLLPPAYKRLPEKAFGTRPIVAAALQLGALRQDLSLPIALNENPPTAAPEHALKVDRSQSNAKWFNIQKSFGPVHFERIGVSWSDGKITFLLDAALSQAGLTLSLQGLSVTSPLNMFKPKFNLHGLGLDYRKPPLEIGGAFVRVQNPGAPDIYNGAAILRTEAFSLALLGSYTTIGGHPSLFGYGVLDKPLGGPAFFFVTGLAAGFGYNRSLRMPPVGKVTHFPLVAVAAGKASTNRDPAAMLAELGDDIPPEVGQYFLAVGIKFTSFELIDSFALLSVSFGHRFELDILGLSTLLVPPDAGASQTPLAEVQMAFKASYVPDEGFLGVQAQLTPASFILSRKCHLRGGFAFFSWFAGEHEGDFVQTLGGYHPHFKPPGHYPRVPRLGFNWRVDSHTSLKGDAYYALCAHALMAGGHLDANYHRGNLRAWFRAGADFLISWKPYHYEAGIYVDIGASVTYWFFGTHHATVDLGADLSIWGPEFGGSARIHVLCFHFHVSFGAGEDDVPPVPWDHFKRDFLPKKKGSAGFDVCSIQVGRGLVGKAVPRQNGVPDPHDLGLINPKDLVIVTHSVIPSKRAGAGAVRLPVDSDAFGVAPMGLKEGELKSKHAIHVEHYTGDVHEREDPRKWKDHAEHFRFEPIYKRMPKALWGETRHHGLNAPRFLEKGLAGFSLKIAKDPDFHASHAIANTELRYSTKLLKNASLPQKPAAFNPESGTGKSQVNQHILGADAKANRKVILHALGFAESDVDLPKHPADVLIFDPVVGQPAA